MGEVDVTKRDLCDIHSRGDLLRLDVGRPDHLAPLLSFLDNELPEFSRRTGKRNATQVGKARLDVGVGESLVDRLAELDDGLGGRALGRTNAGGAALHRPRSGDRKA